MTKQTEALKLALEALDSKYIVGCGEWRGQQIKAITAIKEALAQPEQPAPVQQKPLAVISAKQLSAMFQNLKDVDQNQSGYHWRVGWNAALRQAMDYSMPPCTTPPEREWVGLTDDELVQIGVATGLERAAAQMIESKLKEKNFD